MNIKLLGPAGIQQRIEEIRQRRADIGLDPNSDRASEGPAPLQGVIPNGKPGTVRPWNPFGDGSSVDGLSSASTFGPLIAQAAQQAGVDPALFDSLVAAESSYDPRARSRAGAMGLSQLMPDTAKSLGVEDPFDPWQNLQGGANYLAQMLKRFDGDPRLALAAYNAGPGAVQKFGGVPPYAETQRYVERVLGHYDSRRNG
ncbi:MAG TPA: lytic transglycosylase domain-containing protein [Fimbriimonadaceae bacterium]|nr:lytic transglycosylase domain-containing protein [Fimbriimonadaceae bacterium]